MGDGDAHDDGGDGFGCFAPGIGRRRRQLGILQRDRILGPDFFGRLVLAKTLEGGLADHARAGPAGKLDFSDENGLHPIPVALLAGRILAGKGALVGDIRLELPEESLGIARVETGANLADMDQMITTIHPGDERAAASLCCHSNRRSPPRGRHGIWIWSRSRCGLKL